MKKNRLTIILLCILCVLVIVGGAMQNDFIGLAKAKVEHVKELFASVTGDSLDYGGHIVGNVYTNEGLNIKVEAKDGFYFLTDEQQKEKKKIANEKLGRDADYEGLAEIFKEFDMAGEGKSLTFSKMYVSDSVAQKYKREGVRADDLSPALDLQLQSMGYTDKEKTIDHLLGEDVPSTTYKMVQGTQGIEHDVYLKSIIAVRKDYALYFIATSVGDDNFEELLGMVSDLN